MVKCTYITEVLINDPKRKTLAIVLYGTITIGDIEICKAPLEVDIFSDDAYYVTVDYDVFVKSWEQQRIDLAKPYVDQMVRFYSNVENFKSKFKKSS